MGVLEAARGLGMENWLEVCSSHLNQIAGFHKDPAWSVLAFVLMDTEWIQILPLVSRKR